MLTTNGKNYIANKFGIGGCFVATGKSWSYIGTDGVTYNESGGTAQIVSRLVMTSLVQSVTVDGVVYTYTALKTANDNTDITLDDASWVAANDGSPAGEAKYCTGSTTSNLVQNPGFESGSGSLPSWWILTARNNNTPIWDTVGYSGARSIKISVPGTTSIRSGLVRSPGVPVSAGQTYTLSIMGRTEGVGGSVGADSGAYTRIEFMSSTGALLTSYKLQFGPGTVAWVKKSGNFAAPAGAVSAYISIVIAGYGTFWADDVSLGTAGSSGTSTPTPTPVPGTTPTPAPQAGSGAPGLVGTYEFILPPTGIPSAGLDLSAVNMRLTTDGRFEINDVKITNLTGYDIYVAAEVRLFAGARTSCPTSGETFKGMDRTQTVNRDQRIRLMNAGEEQIMNLDFYPPQLSGIYTVCIYIHGSYFRADLVQEVGSIPT